MIISFGCSLPLIWDSPVTTVEPPIVVEISPTATERTTGVDGEGSPTPTDLPVQPVTTPTVVPTTPESQPETPVPAPTFAPTPEPPPYILQPGSPVAVPNFAHPELGCDWLGVGGQIFDRRGQPQKSVIVAVGGTMAGIEVDKLVVSGGAAIFGEGGFELKLSERPIGSEKTLWIQLFGISGDPLSDKVLFSTFNDCSQNLILINFLELPSLGFDIYLPMIAR